MMSPTFKLYELLNRKEPSCCCTLQSYSRFENLLVLAAVDLFVFPPTLDVVHRLFKQRNCQDEGEWGDVREQVSHLERRNELR